MNNNPLLVCALEAEFRCNSRKFDLLYTGVGKINAAISMTEFLCENPLPPYVINFGTAGSKKIPVGSLVDCTKFIQRDMDASPLGFKVGQTPFEEDIEITFGREGVTCGTGDKFVTSLPALKTDIVDMEAYAIAKVCKLKNIDFRCFKFISDNADNEAKDDWVDNVSLGAKLFLSLIHI